MATDAGDERTRRLSLRIDKDLKREVDAEAEERGRSLTKFVERALRAALPSRELEATSGGSSTRKSRANVQDAGSNPARPAPPRTPDAGTPLPKIAQRRREW